jgi:hypothetical protein
VRILLKRTVPWGRSIAAWGKVTPELQERNIFYRPDGTEAFALRFPALRTGLLSNVPYGTMLSKKQINLDGPPYVEAHWK